MCRAKRNFVTGDIVEIVTETTTDKRMNPIHPLAQILRFEDSGKTVILRNLFRVRLCEDLDDKGTLRRCLCAIKIASDNHPLMQDYLKAIKKAQ